MIADLLLVSVGLLALLAAAISDIKTREVPDWVSYGLISAGLLIRLAHSIVYQQWSYIGYGLMGLAVLTILGNMMYRTKQWGGGDTKLLMGVGATFATRPLYLQYSSVPFLITVGMNILLIGAAYGLVYGIILAVKNKKRFSVEVVALNKDAEIRRLKIWALAGALAAIIINVVLDLPLQFKLVLGMIAIAIVVYPYLAVLIRAVERSCLYKKMPVSKLTPGDWVEQDVYRNKKLIYAKKTLGIEEQDIAKLIRAKISRVLVKEGIPFIPPFFIGTLISVITGKIIGLL